MVTKTKKKVVKSSFGVKTVKIVWFHKNIIDDKHYTVHWGTSPAMFNKNSKGFTTQSSARDFFESLQYKYSKKGYQLKTQMLFD